MRDTGLSGSSYPIQPEDLWSRIVDGPFFEVSQYLFTSSLHTALRLLIIGCLAGVISGILGIGKTRYSFCHQNESFPLHQIELTYGFFTLEPLQQFLCVGFDVEPHGVCFLGCGFDGEDGIHLVYIS